MATQGDPGEPPEMVQREAVILSGLKSGFIKQTE